MKKLSSLFCFLLISQSVFAAEPNTLTKEEAAEGWVLLFDGKDGSTHFRGYNKEKLPEQWIVEDGALHRTGGGDIITKEKYENFEFSIDWKISEGGNSGIMFKVVEAKGPPYLSGPEAQIIDNAKGKDAQKAGWMYQLYAAEKDTTKPAGEWNHFVLKCQKTPAGTYKCEHWMNGEKYVEYEIGSEDWKAKVAKSKFAKWENFGKAAEGHICLQDHQNPVWFRNIKIRKLEALK
jgi:hypothetical protein